MPSPSPVRAPLRALSAIVAALAVTIAPLIVATPATAAEPTIVVNEVESNGDDTDWVEVYNAGTEPVDLSGALFRDNDATRTPWTLPAGSVVSPGGFFVIDQLSGSNPVGFDFGLGGADEVHLYLADGITEIASHSWTVHSAVSYGRCPDGTGEFATTTVSTKGAPNNCAPPIVINEVESQPSSGEDWVELVNVGTIDVDASGMTIRDSEDDHGYVVPAGTTIAAGGYIVADALGYGLGGSDAVRLFDAGGAQLDAYSWTAHAAQTYGRCPDPKGAFEATSAATKGTQNQCEGVVIDEAWPGGADVRALDAEGTFTGDLSGLDYEPSGSAALGTLWAVQNGDGLLYKIVTDGAGGWAPATGDGWAAGKTLRYPDGSGTVDAEGVTVVADDASGGVYVSSERSNDASSVSRPAVLRYEVGGSGTEIAATHEWNLAADLPGLGANAGLEGITWVPDSVLTAGGFVDAGTGSAYDPADYPGHGEGLFFIGVEGTASVYAYALSGDGSFARIATLATTFPLVADVQYDADRGGLWVVCDEACDGRIAFFELDAAKGAFATTHVFARPSAAANVANEGFAVADDAVCTDGAKPTFYADDADTDGFSLRAGSVSCETPAPATGDLVVTRFDDRYADGLFDTSKTAPSGDVDRLNSSSAAQLVDVNGTRWYISADADGLYRFHDVPVGPAKLYLGHPNDPAGEVFFDATGAASAADIERLPTTDYFGAQGTVDVVIDEDGEERLIGMTALRLVANVAFSDGTPAAGLTTVELGSGGAWYPATEYSFRPGTYEAFQASGYVRHLPGDLGLRLTVPDGYRVAGATAGDVNPFAVAERDGAYHFSSAEVWNYFWNPAFTITLEEIRDNRKPTATLVSPTTAGPFQSLSVRVDATDDKGLKRIVANIYRGGELVKSTQTAAGGAQSASHSATVTLPDGAYTVKYNAQDLAGNISKTGTFAFTIDTTAPAVTVKDGSHFTLQTGETYDRVSFKLFDAGKIDKIVLNGVVKNLTDNAWSDVNFVKPGTFGAVKGANTLVVHDLAGNTRTVAFTLN